MNATEIENEVLAALRRIGPATVPAIKRSLSTATGGGLTFPQVASAVLRLERSGLIYQFDEDVSGVDVHPIYKLSQGGEAAARHVERINRSREAARKKEAADG